MTKLSIPLSKSILEFREEIQTFLAEIDEDNSDFSILDFAFDLFENYLDLSNAGVYIFGMNQDQEFFFSRPLAMQAVRSKSFGSMDMDLGLAPPLFLAKIRTLKEKGEILTDADVILLAVCYFAFLVQIYNSHGDLFTFCPSIGKDSTEYYRVDIFQVKQKSIMQ